MSKEELSPPPITRDDVHRVPDDRFREERVAVVTGAASGIGQATALAAAVNGLSVLATDVDGDGLADTADHAERLDVDTQLDTHVADLEREDDVEEIAERARSLGSVTFLANVAGLQHVAPLESFPTAAFDRLYRVMVRAPFLLTRALWPDLRDDGGCVGNMASLHGHYVTSDKVAYNVSKFAIRGLTQSIAAEGDGTVRSFSVSTGYVKTPLVVDQIPETAEQRGIDVDEVISDVMLGQSRVSELMLPIDVANLFVLGFSDLATHLNGGDLRFDGGASLTYE